VVELTAKGMPRQPARSRNASSIRPGAIQPPMLGILILHVRGLVEPFVVVDAEAWPVVVAGTVPSPPTCGEKNRAATLDMTPRRRSHGRRARSHSKTNRNLRVMPVDGEGNGRVTRTLKSKLLWVYFQMYSPPMTMCAQCLLQAGVKPLR